MKNEPDNILIVDDNPNNLQVLSGILQADGFKVRPALSGELALPFSVVAVQLPLFGTSAQPVHCVVHAVAPGSGVQGPPEAAGVVQTVWHSRAGPV